MNAHPVWINAIAFQLVWLMSVAGAARGIGWIGPLATLVFAAYTLARGGHARADVLLVAIAATLGFALDSAWAHYRVIAYSAAFPSAAIAPLWIVALWANFALSLNHSLAWLQSRPLLAVLFGALGGPLSYFFAERTWHAVTLAAPLAVTLSMLSLTWALVTPFLCIAARRLARFSLEAMRPLDTLHELPR